MYGQCTKKGAGNDKQGKDAGNRTLCPYRNFSQAIILCIHVKEPTKYSKSTDQISGGIWSVNETGFTGFDVDQCKHSFGHKSVDLQRIVTKFGQVNLLVKNFHMQENESKYKAVFKRKVSDNIHCAFLLKPENCDAKCILLATGNWFDQFDCESCETCFSKQSF